MLNKRRSALIVEDEQIIRNSLQEILNAEGYETVAVGSTRAAIEAARARDFDVAICDVQLPDGDGLVMMRTLLQIQSHLAVLIITAYATVENSVEAFKNGAYDYLVKPVIFDDLLHKLERFFRHRELVTENQQLRREIARKENFEELVGSSQALQVVQSAIRKVAATNSNVLLEGETGTGKELFARSIHRAGPRRDEKFLAINCTASPVELLEGELFGYRKGAFSGAESDHPGAFVHAGQGTVFLDEVAGLPLGTQAKLRRAIEYQEITPLGRAEPVQIQCRVIAATTRDLMQEVAEGRFHEDLFYRLNGVKIQIPPLRDRLDDIPELVDHFLAKHTQAMGKRVLSVSSETMRLLMAARWKGNVRQLDNAIERAVIMCEGTQIEPKDLPSDLLGVGQPLPATDDLRSALRHYERLHITRVLKQWPDKREAAKRLRLGLSSLYRKIEELGIDL
ncbi:MAG: sigma-54 dependent transcriptional regulator [Planctomycetales bacterium]